MSVWDIIQQSAKEKYLILTESQLSDLLSNSTLIEEHNTVFSDIIRLLEIEKHYYIQEKTLKNEILFRQCQSLQTAKDFVQNRLAIYDKMWDGCGCKVRYFE